MNEPNVTAGETTTTRMDPLLRLALTLWIVLAVASCFKVARQPDSHTVYPVFAQGARNWWADVPLYDRYEGLDLFRYSPAFAIAMTPFGLFADRFGGMLWNLAGVAALVWSLRVFVRDVLPGVWTPRREAWLLGLTLVGSIRGVWSGQNNSLLLAAALLGVAAIARRQWWRAAFLLAVPVFIKVWPLALVLLLLVRWPKELVGRFAVAVGFFGLVPFLTRPLDIVCRQYHDWFSMLLNTRQTRWGGYRDLWTIWEAIHPSASGTEPGHLYAAIQLAAAGCVLIWCLWRYHRAASVRHALTGVVSMWLVWQLLLGPGSERLTYLIIAPVASWAVVAAFVERRGRTLALAAWITIAILGTGNMERTLLKLGPPIGVLAPALLPFGVVLFLAWLLWHDRGAFSSPDEP